MNWLKSFFRISITPTVLLLASDTVNRSVYNFATFTPQTNAFELIAVGHSGTLRDISSITTTTGLNLVLVSDCLLSTTHKLSLFRAMKASGLSAGTITLTLTGSASRAVCMVVESTNTDTTGVDGAGAAVQTLASNVIAATALSLNLPNAIGAGNATFGFFQTSILAGAITPGAGYTELAEGGPGSEAQDNQAEWRSDGQTAVNVTNASADIGGIAIEVKAAGAAVAAVRRVPQQLMTMGMGR